MLGVLEPGAAQPRQVVLLLQRPGDAARPRLDAVPDVLGIRHMSPWKTMSETANRPPGLSTRKASASTRSLSG